MYALHSDTGTRTERVGGDRGRGKVSAPWVLWQRSSACALRPWKILTLMSAVGIFMTSLAMPIMEILHSAFIFLVMIISKFVSSDI